MFLGEIEVDAHGLPVRLPDDDQFIDTDLLHGMAQRIHVDMIIPEATRIMGLTEQKRFYLRGEMACLVQFGHENSVCYGQRALRRALARMRRLRERLLLVDGAMHAAAVMVSSWAQAKITRWKFLAHLAELQVKKRWVAAIVIQRFIRGWPKWHKYQRYLQEKRIKHLHMAATHMQRIIRGFIARRILSHQMKGKLEVRAMIEKQWGVLVIQKIARGYIARKTVVRALKIRSTLSGPVLHLAERYMKSGDMWGFLREVEQSLGRLHREMRENEVREDTMATTFVEKVLVQRKADFDGAWGTFSKVVADGANAQNQQGGKSPWDDTTGGAAAAITSHPLLRKQSSGSGKTPQSKRGSRGGGASGGDVGKGRKGDTTSDVISAVGPLPDLTHQHPHHRPMTGLAVGTVSPSTSGRYTATNALLFMQSTPYPNLLHTHTNTTNNALSHPINPPTHLPFPLPSLS